MPVSSFKRNKFTTGSYLTPSTCPYALPYFTRKAERTRSSHPNDPTPSLSLLPYYLSEGYRSPKKGSS